MSTENVENRRERCYGTLKHISTVNLPNPVMKAIREAIRRHPEAYRRAAQPKTRRAA